MGILIGDIRYGVRQLRKSPGFAAVAIVTLAVGIGASITMFGFVNAYLLRPFPYDDAERLVDFTGTHATFGRMSISYANYLDWRKQNRTFEEMACYRDARNTVKGADVPERLRSMQVTANLLPMLGVKASLGRLFRETDDHGGAERTVILSHGLWQRRFGGDPDVVGRTMVLDDRPHTVVGVLPSSFAFPPFHREPAELWTPIGLLEQYEWFTNRRNHQGTAGIGKLKEGVTLASARADLNRVAEQLEQTYPDTNGGCRVAAVPFHERVLGDMRLALLVLMGSALAVLLIVCVNIADLLLVRSSARSQEFAVRRALGAGRLRLIRQLMGENLVLALLGAAGGVVVALWGLSLLSTLLGSQVALSDEDLLRIDANMVVFVLGAAIGTLLILGLAPAWHCTGRSAGGAIRDSVRTATATKDRSHLRDGLVVTQIALALVLMSCAGLMVRSFVHYLQADPGYNPDSTVTFDLRVPAQTYTTDEQKAAFYRDLVRHVESMPPVRHAGVTCSLLGGWQSTYYVQGAPIPEANEEIFAEYSEVSPDLFQAMGIPLLAGRSFTERDTHDAPSVVVVDEEFARKWWPGESAVGKRIQVHRGRPDSDAPWSEVVGVVRHVKHYGVDRPSRETIYLCMDQSISDYMTLVVRTQGDPLALVTPIRRAVAQNDSDIPVYNIQTLQAIGAERSFMRRATTTVLGAFALTALLLAALGIYGVMAYSVSRRTNEIGVRIALGACWADIVRLVLGRGGKLTLVGVALGLLASLGLGWLIRGLLFGVTAWDPLTFAAVTLALAIMALLACLIPARRAAKIDPMKALRYE